MPLNIRELLSGMRNERPAPLSIRPRPSVRPSRAVDVRRFYCGDKKLVFMVRPIEIQFTTHVAAAPAGGGGPRRTARGRGDHAARYWLLLWHVSRILI